ncbi:MAG TPA: Eco57I restriction-modification methylase domain-containing protein, partial [Ktedonobacteraceae bacterium]|nr:Eco57I restriction-modification methylase domain-containing protein [Ktedonobacteraceae bacterium]
MIDEIASRSEALSKQDADLLDRVDFLRLDAGRKQDRNRQAELGQFFTPAPVARLMASMLTCRSSTVHILDAGAGVGSLFAACVTDLCGREKRPQKICVTAYEIDESLLPYIQDTFRLCRSVCERVGVAFVGDVRQKDFIADSVEVLQDTLFSNEREKPAYTCAILNPPYRKIQTQSVERKLLQILGIESSNLYAGFLAIATQLLAPFGELVAITPRSFCNGPYFKHFRQRFLQTMSLQRLHVFDARDKAFRDDAVLQENIILHAVKSTEVPKYVTISSSTGPMDNVVLVHNVGYEQIVHPKDPQLFIRIVQDSFSQEVTEHMALFQTSLEELGLNVSTGRVVDFRAQDALRYELGANTIPLLFPMHVGYGSIIWPGSKGKKPNALVDSLETKGLQVPNNYYVLVKRFSTKEEKKRIVAAVYDPTTMPGSSVGFENHLNYFHCNGKGISPTLAKGLAAYLNSTLVDSYFRQF